ncbi:Ribosome-binding factor A family protein isoform 1 [Hibiscus syriacus]|uniref:Ribosome-binding factor A family protein isoform 1 n=1 Tax=Hibiscus syriacus TaxID=106335 RepID=A0A6A3CLP4_HIBSY|nr:uncharacterized protein LOC120174093 [Hibiscus syriacus]KAE8730375.1 Ribosome-binding factor A family protein isoform 1 [Hibiscus syriacus]
MEGPETSLVEVREELMVSPGCETLNPCSKTAHFLKPISGSLETELPRLPSQRLSNLEQSSSEPKDLPLSIGFHGWRCRASNWSIWVDKMRVLHEPTWKKAGIFEAILNSTYQIKRNITLVLGLAEKWCCETKSFILSWGEASVTLEDVMILGGFSVLGSPVFAPLETEESKEVEETLKSARIEIVRSKAKKACPHLWMQRFMDNGSEFEHEAFLAFWLSRYVFTNAHETIREHVFSTAVHLARGTRLALAPAVLASIYRDLCLLKDAITASTKMEKDEVFKLTLWSPFQLVQVWAWERFTELRPQPNPIAKGEPRLVQWHDVSFKVEKVRLALESASGSFEWRPYTVQIDNWKQPKFYRENEVCIWTTARLDKELESFVRCLKVSELVGLDCIEQYLPHRVARQFGMDQDIPGCVPQSQNLTHEIAWLNYCESLTGVKLYIPSRLYKAGVTARYLKWWKDSVLESKGTAKGLKKSAKNPKGKRGESSSGCSGFHQKIESFHGKMEANDTSVSPNCAVKISKKQGDRVNKTKKSKSVSQILEEKQVHDNDSTSPASCRKSSKKSVKNPKGNKNGKEESSSPDVPLGSSKELAQTLKRKKRDNSYYASPDVHLRNSKESVQTLKRKKRDDSDSASPGLSKKCMKKSTKKSEGIKKDTPVSASSKHAFGSSKRPALAMKYKEEGSNDVVSHVLPSASAIGSPCTLERKNGNSSSDPISLERNFNGKEAEDSTEDYNPTISEMLRSCKKRRNIITEDSDDDGNPSGHSQGHSSTIADDEVVKYFEPLAMLAEKVIEDEASLRVGETFKGPHKEQRELEMVQEEVAMGESERTTEHEKEDNPEQPVHEMPSINGVERECSCYAVDIPGLTLEARISRLEKLVEELKAMRSACK